MIVQKLGLEECVARDWKLDIQGIGMEMRYWCSICEGQNKDCRFKVNRKTEGKNDRHFWLGETLSRAITLERRFPLGQKTSWPLHSGSRWEPS